MQILYEDYEKKHSNIFIINKHDMLTTFLKRLNLNSRVSQMMKLFQTRHVVES